MTNFIDISAKVLSGGERGLLGLDFNPNYSTNGFFMFIIQKMEQIRVKQS